MPSAKKGPLTPPSCCGMTSRFCSLQLKAAACAECQTDSDVQTPAELWVPCCRISVRQAWQGSRRASTLCWWPQMSLGAVLMSRMWPASSTTTCPTASRTTPIALDAQGVLARRAMPSPSSPCRQGGPLLKACPLACAHLLSLRGFCLQCIRILDGLQALHIMQL